MMPYAKGASAKTIDFDANGNCVETHYYRMLKIIRDSSFHGYFGIEYEGEKIWSALLGRLLPPAPPLSYLLWLSAHLLVTKI